MAKQMIAQKRNDRHSGKVHYLHRRDLEQHLDYHRRLNLHLARLTVYLAARLREVRR